MKFIRSTHAVLTLVVVLAVGAGTVVYLNQKDEDALPLLAATSAEVAVVASSPQQIARGAYLATAGNCAACHTARGGAFYAGGAGIDLVGWQDRDRYQ